MYKCCNIIKKMSLEINKIMLDEKKTITKIHPYPFKKLIEPKELGVSIGYMCNANLLVNFAMTCQFSNQLKYKNHIT